MDISKCYKYVTNYEQYINYESYLKQYNESLKVKNLLIENEGEKLSYKNDVSIRYTTDRNPRNTPYALIESRLNVLDGATFSDSGQAIYYEIEINESGLYLMTLKSKVTKDHTRIFHTVTIRKSTI